MTRTDPRRMPAAGALAAIQFLTRIPIRTPTEPRLTTAVPWFPVVGGLIGALIGGVVVGLGELVPMTVAAAVGVLLGVLVTGAFHEDGLADVADAFAGGWTRDERFRILRDPLHGSYGVAALAGSILLRVVAVASMPPAWAFGGLVTAHALGRAAAVGAMGTVPTARPDGLGADYVRELRRPAAAIGVGAGIAIGALAIGIWVLPTAFAALTAALVVGWLAFRKVGGVTGDVLGAVEQVAECLVLVTVSGLAVHHDLWWR